MRLTTEVDALVDWASYFTEDEAVIRTIFD